MPLKGLVPDAVHRNEEFPYSWDRLHFTVLLVSGFVY
jgi:hypothetical protein